MNAFELGAHELTVTELPGNLPTCALYEHAIRYEKNVSIAENGVLVAYSGAKTGRSPKDKRVVKNPASAEDSWWGSVNIPLHQAAFTINRNPDRTFAVTQLARNRSIAHALMAWATVAATALPSLPDISWEAPPPHST
jgi:ATP-dependent phosphoenolpyruvate carboxykinase